MAGVSKGGRASLGTRSCLQGLVCYTLDGGRGAKGACGMATQDAFAHAGQAGFAGGTAGKDEACETLKPPGRQRMCGLGGSGATGKPTQPRCPRCIKPSSPVLRCSRFSFLDIAPKNGFAFCRNSLQLVFIIPSAGKNKKCVISQKPPLPFSANWDSPDRAKSGSRDLQSDAFSSCPSPQG